MSSLNRITTVQNSFTFSLPITIHCLPDMLSLRRGISIWAIPVNSNLLIRAQPITMLLAVDVDTCS